MLFAECQQFCLSLNVLRSPDHKKQCIRDVPLLQLELSDIEKHFQSYYTYKYVDRQMQGWIAGKTDNTHQTVTQTEKHMERQKKLHFHSFCSALRQSKEWTKVQYWT